MRITVPVLLGFLLIWAAAPLHGQTLPIPEISDGSRVRREYTADVRRDFNQLMVELGEAWVGGDERAFLRLFSPVASLILPDAHIARGRDQIGALLNDQPEVEDFRTGLTDFTASGSLAFALGPYWYQPAAETAGPTATTGRYVAVLEREGNAWRIRSLLLQPDPLLPDAG